jgi:hypothetical protein
MHREIFLVAIPHAEVFARSFFDFLRPWLCSSVLGPSIGQLMFHPLSSSRWADRKAPSKVTIKDPEATKPLFFGHYCTQNHLPFQIATID